MTDTLVFVDLETTGLGVSDQTIEIGILPVDINLVPLDEGFSAVITTDPTILTHMGQTVTEMHTVNGLLAELAAGECRPITEVTADVMDYLNKWGQPGQVPLAGSSVHFDRKFLAKNLPRVENWFHYRNFDISTIKQMWRLWFPGQGEPPKLGNHRALQDCYASVAEGKWYKDRLRTIMSDHPSVPR